MSISAEKRNGRLTGYFRVEVGRKDSRLRGRAESFEEAKVLEDEFRLRLEGGWKPASRTSDTPKWDCPTPETLQDALGKAQDRLWREGLWKPQAIAHVRSLAVQRHLAGPLRGLTEEDFAEAVETLLETKAPSTVNRALSAVSKVLKHARKKGWMEREIELPWQREGDGRVRWLTEDEERELVKALPADMQAFVTLAVETGCRRGELLRLRREDQISKDWLVLHLTKAGRPRAVPQTERAQVALGNLMALGVPSQQRVRHHFEIARKKAGLEGVCFHVLRHTCATRLLQRGVDLQVTKEWLGHSDLKTTLRYRHVSDSLLKAAAKQMERAA